MRARWLLLTLLLAGCAGSPRGVGTPTKDSVKSGVIESVTPITLDDSSNAGSMAGGIFGQVGGANTGAGRGAVIGSVFGSVLGGTLGHQAGIATKNGVELWIKLDGETQSTYVMQPGKAEAFKVGERVRLSRKQGELRAEPEPQSANTPR